MNMNRVFLVLLYIFVGLALIIKFYSTNLRLVKNGQSVQYVDYSSSIYHPVMIPTMLAAIGILMPMMGIFTLFDYVYGILFPMFIELSLYYAILICCAPLVKRKLSAKACAALWILPNLMYVAYVQPNFRVQPDVVISLNHQWAIVLMIVWGLGFFVTMGWYILTHLQFRKKILKHSKKVFDDTIFKVWQEELKESEVKIKLDSLLICEHLTTPLTIGLFRGSIRVLLPHKEYTEHQLRLIFRHELVHLKKDDNLSKFFFAFCNALCWFNPLMWGAMKQCAEDLERSCDAAILMESDETQRKVYAELILNSDADQRGFTTCLTSSFESMRYRLKEIMTPVKLHSGIGVLVAVVLLLSMMTGKTAFAYHSRNLDFSNFGNLVKIEIIKHDGITVDDVIQCKTDKTVIDKLSELEVNEMSLMYQNRLSHDLCLSMKFEDVSWYSLEIAEIENGLLIYEEYRKEKYYRQIYFCEGETIDSILSMLNLETTD